MFLFRNKIASSPKTDMRGVKVTLDELLRLRFSAERLNWFTSHTAQSIQAGNKLSRARGRGMEFSEVRSYQAGDDIRLINWQMTARTGKPYTKVYHEERERPVYVITDTSMSMYFGTQVAFKSVIAARCAALIAWAALAHHDQIGGMVLNDNDMQTIIPKRQRKTLLQLLSCVADYGQQQIDQHTPAECPPLLSALTQLQQRRIQGATVCLLSDFMTCNKEVLTRLQTLSADNDITLLFIYDHLEQHAPKAGLYPVSDGDRQLLINTADSRQVKLYTDDFNTRWDAIEQLCRTSRCQFLPVATSDDLIKTLNKRGLVHA